MVVGIQCKHAHDPSNTDLCFEVGFFRVLSDGILALKFCPEILTLYYRQGGSLMKAPRYNYRRPHKWTVKTDYYLLCH